MIITKKQNMPENPNTMLLSMYDISRCHTLCLHEKRQETYMRETRKSINIVEGSIYLNNDETLPEYDSLSIMGISIHFFFAMNCNDRMLHRVFCIELLRSTKNQLKMGKSYISKENLKK